MVCTRSSLMPCLSSGLDKNNEIMSMFVPLPSFFGHFESLALFSKMDRQTLCHVKSKAVKQDVLVNFSKVQQSSQFFRKE